MQVMQATGVHVMQATDVHVIRYLLSLTCDALHVASISNIVCDSYYLKESLICGFAVILLFGKQ